EDQRSPTDEAHEVKSEIGSGGGSSSSSPPVNYVMCCPPPGDVSPPTSISPLACLHYLRLLSAQLGDVAPAMGVFRELFTSSADAIERSRTLSVVTEEVLTKTDIVDCASHPRLASPLPHSLSSAEDMDTEKSSGLQVPTVDTYPVSLDDPADFYLRCNRPRRSRTTFTTLQLHVLEAAFGINHYPDVAMRDQLASQLKLSDGRVQVSGFTFKISVVQYFACKYLLPWDSIP
ncbi:unnamed protein product, partial [Schistocephalus solidus]|uniref:Homeobox domain-containing protein n=1 Tax=Schistocephalus solidus TaxID=70667 RepID=A0A183TAT7_SCHSO